MFVADDGVGAGTPSDGFGVSRSIRERMDAVGGSALIGPGPQGRGTVVLLEWRPQAAGRPSRSGSDLLPGTAGIVLMVATFLAGVASALVVLGWSAYARPVAGPGGGLRARAGRRPGSSARAREGRRVGASQVLAACATYVLVGAVALLADPYCSSLLGEGVMLDARAPMMAVLLLLAPRPGVLGAIVATVGLAHLGGGAGVERAVAALRGGHGQAGVYVVAALAAAWLFVERIDRVSTQLAGAREQARSAQVRIGPGCRVRAEEELWVADTLASAQELLDDIAEGRRDPGDPRTRSDCAAQAEFLRALLAVGRAPMTVRRPARIWLRLLHAATCRIRVRGVVRGPARSPPAWSARSAGSSTCVCALAPGADVTLVVVVGSRSVHRAVGRAAPRWSARVPPWPSGSSASQAGPRGWT